MNQMPPKTIFDLPEEDRAAAAMAIIETGKQRTKRECGSCSLCCKILPVEHVPEISKPVGEWCKHCRPGEGCGIYQSRPAICSAFACMWLMDPSLADYWQPSRSKIVVRQVPDLPLFSPPPPLDIKQAAYIGLNAIGGIPFRVYVEIGARLVLILPKKDLDVTDHAHVIANTGGPNEWEVATFDIPERAQQVRRRRGGRAQLPDGITAGRAPPRLTAERT